MIWLLPDVIAPVLSRPEDVVRRGAPVQTNGSIRHKFSSNPRAGSRLKTRAM